MKKLAGRDFEDILQVSTFLSLLIDLTNFVLSSVGSLYSKVSYRTRNTTRQYSTLRSTLPPGTLMGNSASTRRTRSSPSAHRRRRSAVSSATTPTRCAPSMQQNRCQERLLLPLAAKLQRPRRPRRLHQPPKHLGHRTQSQLPEKT